MLKSQWVQFLNKSSEDITDDEWNHVFNSANNWCGCAVGCLVLTDDEVCKNPPKTAGVIKNGRVLDIIGCYSKLYKLGFEFYRAINARNITKAREIFSKIHSEEFILCNGLLVHND